MPSHSTARTGLTLGIYALTLFTSACIIFMMQPLVGKMLLPIVGGAPAGWIVAMAFFQIMLLAGYLTAHWLSTLKTSLHGMSYALGLSIGLACLPFSFAGHAFSETPGAGDVFMLLCATVAVPFIAISATSSTIQRLFTSTGHPSAADPYFLYAASNLGSFAGLLLYPLLIEPTMTIQQQQGVLSTAYGFLLALTVICILLSARADKMQEKRDFKLAGIASQKIGSGQKLEWLALSFLPSSLLLGVTIYITTDVISAPMIWILPLALYLMTFVVAFGKHSAGLLTRMERLHTPVIFIAIILISLLRFSWLSSFFGVAFYLVIFTMVALTCHLRLAGKRPDESHLTSFYLMMSIGGALGGVLNAFIIPVLFSRILEFPIMLLASFMLHPSFDLRSRGGKAFMVLLALSVLLVNVPPPNLGMTELAARWSLALGLLFVIVCTAPKYYKQMIKPSFVALATIVIFMVTTFGIGDAGQIVSLRNFYGTIRVYDRRETFEGVPSTLRIMQHGSTIHGTQWLDPAHEMQPTSYHIKDGPLGDVFSVLNPKKVAVIGLGAGAMNCYNAKDREFTFVEIDPDVVRVAQDNFTFLKKCVSKKPPRLITGDGRLELARLQDDKFDLLVMDAFTSDSIPTHLLTQEAFKTYFDRLTPGGHVAVNISNRYFSLWNMVAASVAPIGIDTDVKLYAPKDGNPSNRSMWLVLSRHGEMPKEFAAKDWKFVKPDPAIRPWTDDYSNLLSAMSVFITKGLPK